jgi:hydroxymethylbilane synthase
MQIKIGTRGSKLALWQAYYIEEKLKAQGADTEIVIIETKGDKILDKSLSKIGSKGLFTEELEEQLRLGKIDIAVHSAKDLQSELPQDLKVIAFTARETVNDVVVSFDKSFSLHSQKPFVVGTSSTRRVAMLKAYFPHIRVVDMRGNLQTRLRKLEENHCDALILAYAGVHRMNYDDLIVEMIPTERFTPAVGQGSVAIEIAENLIPEKIDLIRNACNDTDTEKCLLAERAYLRKLQGGCSIPVFGNASLSASKDEIILRGGIISLDGKQIIREEIIGDISTSEMIGEALANIILEKGGDKILKEIKKTLYQ